MFSARGKGADPTFFLYINEIAACQTELERQYRIVETNIHDLRMLQRRIEQCGAEGIPKRLQKKIADLEERAQVLKQIAESINGVIHFYLRAEDQMLIRIERCGGR